MNTGIEILARGILLCDQWLLVCRNRLKGYAYLPGGHVEMGELAGCALEREFVEESRLAVHAGPLVAVAECSFRQEGQPRHEINLVFLVEHSLECDRSEPCETPNTVESCEPGIIFEWTTMERIPSLDLRPRIIKEWLAQQSGSPRCAPVALLSSLDS